MNLFLILAILAAFVLDEAFSRRSLKKSWSPEARDTNTVKCRSGDGSSYTGSVSESAYGSSCLNWNKFSSPWRASKGLGNHNYCRNPDKSLMPWCYVRRGRRAVKQFCDIPRCSTPSVQPPPAMDSERTCGERSERRMNKIVGGSFTPIESHPWVAALFNRRHRFLCGGSLIAPCWVLTAAHCLFDGDEIINTMNMSVYLGKTAINDTDADREQRFTVEKLIIHKKYNADNYNNDIALLKIKSRNGGCAVKSLSARTVCLPPLHTQLPAGIHCSIAGFGSEEDILNWKLSQHLKQTEVKLISRTVCESETYYGKLITPNMFCAGSPDWSTDACKGDSGGPLVCQVSDRMFLFGVVSWGEGCARKNKPGVYTQVTNYNKWIAAKTGLSKYTHGIMYPQK